MLSNLSTSSVVDSMLSFVVSAVNLVTRYKYIIIIHNKTNVPVFQSTTENLITIECLIQGKSRHNKYKYLISQ